jgi:uncharacterized protein
MRTTILHDDTRQPCPQRFRRQLLLAGTAAGILLVAGCSLPLPQAQSDPTRFYILSTPNAATPVVSDSRRPAVHLRQVEIANYLRARPMIVRRGENEIEFRDFSRWGEPLEIGIGRVLREELLAQGAAGVVMIPGLRAPHVEYDYGLVVRVLACEGAAGGGVLFRAVWELSTAGATPKPVAQGDYRAADLRWDGQNEATLAAALSQAVRGLGAEIASAIRKDPAR